jgi:AbrB family looped-hinge helix DNA binding protein
VGKARSRITAQGQISVPAEIRRKLGVAPGSVLEWVERGDHVLVRRAGGHSSADVHDALFPRSEPPRAPVDTKEGIRRCIRRKHARD